MREFFTKTSIPGLIYIFILLYTLNIKPSSRPSGCRISRSTLVAFAKKSSKTNNLDLKKAFDNVETRDYGIQRIG